MMSSVGFYGLLDFTGLPVGAGVVQPLPPAPGSGGGPRLIQPRVRAEYDWESDEAIALALVLTEV